MLINCSVGVTESQNHRIINVGKVLQDHVSPTSTPSIPCSFHFCQYIQKQTCTNSHWDLPYTVLTHLHTGTRIKLRGGEQTEEWAGASSQITHTNTVQLRATLVECSGCSTTFNYRFDRNVKICFEKSVFYSRNINIVPQHWQWILSPFGHTLLYFLLPFNQKEFLEVSTPLLFLPLTVFLNFVPSLKILYSCSFLPRQMQTSKYFDF